MHEHNSRAALCKHAEHRGILGARADIVHEVCACVECGFRDTGVRCVDRNRNIRPRTNARNRRHNATNLFVNRHARGARSRAFATNIDHGRALIDQGERELRNFFGARELPAIRKAIWCDVHDTHQRERIERQDAISTDWKELPVT
jgi:hypothetical protein